MRWITHWLIMSWAHCTFYNCFWKGSSKGRSLSRGTVPPPFKFARQIHLHHDIMGWHCIKVPSQCKATVLASASSSPLLSKRGTTHQRVASVKLSPISRVPSLFPGMQLLFRHKHSSTSVKTGPAAWFLQRPLPHKASAACTAGIPSQVFHLASVASPLQETGWRERNVRGRERIRNRGERIEGVITAQTLLNYIIQKGRCQDVWES